MKIFLLSDEEKQTFKEKKPSSKPSFKQLKDFETIEKDIHLLETEKDQVMERMNSGNESTESYTDLSIKYNQLVQLIDDKTMLWMELGEIIENSKI